MTEEQYKRACEIRDRITGLNEVKDELASTGEHRLTYCAFTGEWSLCSMWKMALIRNILDKHDAMIRQEIEDELKNLENEIKTL